jgi:hypothetical protein
MHAAALTLLGATYTGECVCPACDNDKNEHEDADEEEEDVDEGEDADDDEDAFEAAVGDSQAGLILTTRLSACCKAAVSGVPTTGVLHQGMSAWSSSE